MVAATSSVSVVSRVTESGTQPGEIQQRTRRSLRSHGLRQSARFQAVRKQGRWWSHRLLALGVLANGLDESRCGFSTSKRLGSAVSRNRARRHLREAVRQIWSGVKPGWDLVLAAREPLTDAPFSDIEDAVEMLLQRAQILGAPTE